MNERYVAAIRYLKAVEESLQLGWSEFYSLGRTEVSDKLALIHPDHFSSLDLPKGISIDLIQRKIQGLRKFPHTSPRICRSDLIWGYRCEFSGDFQQDHLFPYSLGGPTLASNRVHLCRYHNMVKSSDIHCYPWESTLQYVNPWLDIQIERINREIYSIYS